MVGIGREARWAAWALAVTAVLIATTPALAQESDAELAKKEYELGYAALQAGDYEQALDHYQRSYAITPRPRTLFNIAVAEEKLDRIEDAIRHYTEFLAGAEERDEEFKTQARLKIDELKKRLPPKAADAEPSGEAGAKRPAPPPPTPEVTRCPAPSDTGTLRIRSNGAGAEVAVDGAVVGATAATARAGAVLVHALSAGPHDVIVERSGGRTWSRQLHVSPGETVSVEVAFHDRYAGWRWGLTGLGIASVATGGTIGVLALRDVASSDLDVHDRGKSRALLSDLLFVGGAAALYGAWRLWRRPETTATVQRAREGAGR